MSRTEVDDTETLYFPSQAWFAEYRERINDDDAYAEAASDWGTDFDGDFVFRMEEMPVEDLDTAAMPDSLAEDLERYVTEEDGSYVGHALLGLEGGKCTDARLVESAESVEAGFTLTADNETWKRLMAGELGVVDGMMSGHFEIDGDMQKVMQYSQAAVRLTEAAADIDAEFADDAFAE
jgi:putative sterol carrier protein